MSVLPPTFPVMVPGAARLGTPVVDTDNVPGRVRRGFIVRVPDVSADRPRISVAITSVNGDQEFAYESATHPCHYGIDLSDSTGRAHLAWYVGIDLPAFVVDTEGQVVLRDVSGQEFVVPDGAELIGGCVFPTNANSLGVEALRRVALAFAEAQR